jgi:patatin-like phospholipase/acyl hydrolase
MLSHYPSLQEHFNAEVPKRILSLDGGGVRGILSLGLLLQIETLLRARHGNDPQFRLCHYFDLIAGTSTGSIIAALLAKGW